MDGSTATASPDPPSIDPTGASKDFLFIAAVNNDGEEADDDTWGNTPPTSYTPSPPRQKASGTGGVATTNISLETAERQLNTAGPEDPGTFANDVSHTYAGATVAVHPTTLQTKDLSDTVTFSDSQTRGVSFGLSDTATFTDSQTRGISFGLLDSLVFSDLLDKGIIYVSILSDTVVFSDSQTRGVSIGFVDSSVFSDSIGRLISSGLSDLVSFSESLGATLQAGEPPAGDDSQGGPSMFPQPQPRPFVALVTSPSGLYILVSIIGGTGTGTGLMYLNHRGVVSRRFALVVGSNVVFGFFLLLFRVGVVKFQPVTLNVAWLSRQLIAEIAIVGVLGAAASVLFVMWWREEQ